MFLGFCAGPDVKPGYEKVEAQDHREQCQPAKAADSQVSEEAMGCKTDLVKLGMTHPA
jgi:hypothetical protein